MREFDPKSILEHEFQIFGGKIGSGKTEISINLAIKMHQSGFNTVLFDMDIVKPYVRIRDIKDKLTPYGFEIVSPPELTRAIDLPVFPKNVIGKLMDKDVYKILDVGGDPYGAGSIAQFREIIREGLYNFFFIINTRRPETSNKVEIIRAIKKIQDASRMKVTHLVLNTHLRWETTSEIVREGYDIVREVSNELNIPIAFLCVDENHKELVDSIDLPYFPLKLFVNPLPIFGV